jgi:lipoprotein-anchoring transpeptidase ErfK/SrfK
VVALPNPIIPILRIDTDTQTARLETDGIEVRRYSISSGRSGNGNDVGSLKTPLGLHRIAEKFGEGAPIGTIFRGRVPTGEVWASGGGEDLVLSRILWLAGLEAENGSTYDRFIYLHGTNHEGDLGSPASHGCIRFSNSDIVDLFDRLPIGALVEIR